MNLIYIRPAAPKARKFIRQQLRDRKAAASIYNIAQGDCCLAPVPVKRGDFLLTYVGGLSAAMLEYIYGSAGMRRISSIGNNSPSERRVCVCRSYIPFIAFLLSALPPS